MTTTEATTAAPEAPVKKKSKLPVLIVMVLMGVEGAGIFLLTKMFLSPTPSSAEAADGEHHEPSFEDSGHAESSDHGSSHGKAQATAEVDLADCRPNNIVTGKLIHFKLRVSALVSGADAEKAAELIKSNQARINDRVNYVIRSAEPHHLGEAGLETIKRRLKREIDAIVGDEKLVKEILIPEMLQSGSGL